VPIWGQGVAPIRTVAALAYQKHRVKKLKKQSTTA
jgi:hypothetical protein